MAARAPFVSFLQVFVHRGRERRDRVLGHEVVRGARRCLGLRREQVHSQELGVAKRASPPRTWPAKMWGGLARPAKLLRVRISDPPRIRVGPRVCGPTHVFF